MPDWLEILILAVASSFWPTLILIVVVALRLEHPIGVLVWFLAAGLLTIRRLLRIETRVECRNDLYSGVTRRVEKKPGA